MSVIIFVVKLLASFFMLGFVLSGLGKLSPAHQNPEADPFIERVFGMFGIALGICGLYYLWLA